MLERYLKKLFTIADTNGDGVLQPEEMSRLLELSGFNFDKSQVSELVAAADANQNGVIEYDEFIPVAMKILQGRNDAGLAPMPRMQDVPAPMLERYFKKLFNIADLNGDGVLQPAEFKKLLQLSGFNIPSAKINELMAAADVNQDGVIQYEEFIPVAMQLVLGQQDMIDSFMAKESHPAARAALAKPAPAPTRTAPSEKVAQNSDVASLEARVLAVQSRRIIRSKIKDLFVRLDSDRDGRLSTAELATAFGTSNARRIEATLDRNGDGRVTQFEMRRFFDDECKKAVESGVPEYKYLEGIVEMLESIP